MDINKNEEIADIDGEFTSYWVQSAKESYENGDYNRSLVYSKRAWENLKSDNNLLMLYISSMIRNNSIAEALEVIKITGKKLKEDEAKTVEPDYVENILLDLSSYFMPNIIDDIINKNIIDDLDLNYAIVDIALFCAYGVADWKSLALFFNNELFKSHRGRMLYGIYIIGRVDSFEWIYNNITEMLGTEDQSMFASVLFIYAEKLPEQRKKIAELALKYIDHDDNSVREIVLPLIYFYCDNGGELILKALDQGSCEVQCVAVELLLGKIGVKIKEDWSAESSPTNEIDSLVTEDVVIKMLNSPISDIFDYIVDEIINKKIKEPSNFDQIISNKTYDDESRIILMKVLAYKPNAENMKKLKYSALNDPNELVKSKAFKLLRTISSDLTVDS